MRIYVTPLVLYIAARRIVSLSFRNIELGSRRAIDGVGRVGNAMVTHSNGNHLQSGGLFLIADCRIREENAMRKWGEEEEE